ncbi:MAG: hypothetical protein AB1511_04765 [Deinococcota bacterium]
MTRTLSLVFLTLLTLASPAQALKLIVWDRELQTKLGYGETSGGRMTVQLVQDYSGPVVALFSREEDEKARGLYLGLQSRYDGTLKTGLLTLEVQNTPVTLSKFLTSLKLNLVLQPAGQVFVLPGLRSLPDKLPTNKLPTDPVIQGGR